MDRAAAKPQEEQDLTVGASDPQEEDVQEAPVTDEPEPGRNRCNGAGRLDDRLSAD